MVRRSSVRLEAKG